MPMVVEGQTGSRPCFGNVRVCDCLFSHDALVLLGVLARNGLKFILGAGGPHAIVKATGATADMKFVGNPFCILSRPYLR